MVPTGFVKGVDGLRMKFWAKGEDGAKPTGVPGRDDLYEWKELRDVGREGRLIGVRKRNGTCNVTIRRVRWGRSCMRGGRRIRHPHLLSHHAAYA